MRFTITQDHIDRGCRCVGQLCPITLAVKEQHPPTAKYKGFVSTSSASLQIGKRCYKLPTAARKFVRLFDESKTVEPFTFDINTEPTS